MTEDELLIFKEHIEIYAREYPNAVKTIKVLQKVEYILENFDKMKNCGNCGNWDWKHNRCEKKLKGKCFKASKWEEA